MNLDSNLICFKHCCSSSIFCKEVPEKCPICDKLLITLLLEPFVIPYPLVNAKDHPYSVTIRPSMGDFLDTYNFTDELHIGITNSFGQVIEYDKCGLIENDNIKWRNCAVIQFIPDSWQIFWDETLTTICTDSKWNSDSYDDIKFNCFNFVICFLKKLKYSNVQFMNKEEMCKIFILPKIQNILKYTLIYKNLKYNNIYIQE